MSSSVNVSREDALTKLKANREQHSAEYETARKRYREVAVRELRDRADAIERGGDVNLNFHLPRPENHTEDYDEAIEALEWDRRKEVQLTRIEFRQFILDKWVWVASFAANTRSYTSGAQF